MMAASDGLWLKQMRSVAGKGEEQQTTNPPQLTLSLFLAIQPCINDGIILGEKGHSQAIGHRLDIAITRRCKSSKVLGSFPAKSGLLAGHGM